MTGPEHYTEAEKRLEDAKEWGSPDAPELTGKSVQECRARRDATLAYAQVHATLALAAATGMSGHHEGMPIEDHWAWDTVAGVPRNA